MMSQSNRTYSVPRGPDYTCPYGSRPQQLSQTMQRANVGFFPGCQPTPRRHVPQNVNNFDHNVLNLSNRRAVSTDRNGVYSYCAPNEPLSSRGEPIRPVPKPQVCDLPFEFCGVDSR